MRAVFAVRHMTKGTHPNPALSLMMREDLFFVIDDGFERTR